MLSAAWISPSPATKGQKTEGAGNLSRRLGIYGEDDLNNDNIWSSTMKSIPSMIYYGNLNKYSEISETSAGYNLTLLELGGGHFALLCSSVVNFGIIL